MNANFRKILREKTSVHEAAHAVAFVRLGLTEYMGDLRLQVPDELPTDPEPGATAEFGYLELTKQPTFPYGTTDPVELQWIEDLCLCHLAAKPAEMRYVRDILADASDETFAAYRWPSGDSDVMGAIRVAFVPHAHGDLGAIRAYVHRVWERATAFVNAPENWYIIQRLAAQLESFNTIPKAQVIATIERLRKQFRLTPTPPLVQPAAETDKQRLDSMPAMALGDETVIKAFRDSLLPDLYA